MGAGHRKSKVIIIHNTTQGAFIEGWWASPQASCGPQSPVSPERLAGSGLASSSSTPASSAAGCGRDPGHVLLLGGGET